MPWRGPEFEGEFPTLGWDLALLVESYLKVVDGAQAGEPFRFSDDQLRFVLRLYELDPVSGARVIRRAVFRRAKGMGKSPAAAALAICELVGPVVFDGWDAHGNPVGRSKVAPAVYMAATAEEQVQYTYGQAYDMLAGSPMVDEYRIDLGKTRVFLRDRPGLLQPVTAESKSREGARPTFVVMDETHLWLPSNGGVRLAQSLRRGAAKVGGVTVETTNAHAPGEGSVAELSWQAWQGGAEGVLYDSRELPFTVDHRDDDELRRGLAFAYEPAPWVPQDRIFAECRDPNVTAAEIYRFYLNVIHTSSEDLADMEVWAAHHRPDATLAAGDVLGVGFDGSESDDATVLWGLRWPDLTFFELGVWERPEMVKQWRVPRVEVDDRVREVLGVYRVPLLLADPPYWRTDIDRWAAEWGAQTVLEFATGSDQRMRALSQRWDSLMASDQWGHDGSLVLTRHVAAARKASMRGGGWRPLKKDTRKIDGALAAMLAAHALGTAEAKGLCQPAAPAVSLPPQDVQVSGGDLFRPRERLRL